MGYEFRVGGFGCIEFRVYRVLDLGFFGFGCRLLVLGFRVVGFGQQYPDEVWQVGAWIQDGAGSGLKMR